MTLRRFLKRDLIDFRGHWIFLALATALAISAALFFAGRIGLHYVYIPLVQIYGLYGFIVTMIVYGGTPRQHSCLSRHYLLSLPIKRKELFVIQHVRSFIFWLPFVVLCGLYPLMPFEHLPRGSVIIFYPALLVTVGIANELSVSAAICAETSNRYASKGERFGVGVVSACFILMAYLLLMAWIRLASPFTSADVARQLAGRKFDLLFLVFAVPWPQFVFPTYGLLLFFWVPRNARKWCVAL